MRCMFWCKQMFDGAQHMSAPLSMPSMSLGHVHSPTGQHQSPPVSPSVLEATINQKRIHFLCRWIQHLYVTTSSICRVSDLPACCAPIKVVQAGTSASCIAVSEPTRARLCSDAQFVMGKRARTQLSMWC
jgi:hypothetical protein